MAVETPDTKRNFVHVEKGDGYWTWLGPIVPSGQIDTQGESQTDDEIRKHLWDWFTSGRAVKIDSNHDYDEKSVHIVGADIARKGDPDFPEGTSYARGMTTDPVIGLAIEKGELNAWSWAGPVERKKYLAIVAHPILASGTTEKSDQGPYPEHDHEVTDLRFDENAKVIPTRTEMKFAHDHEIRGTTRTEFTDGHCHPWLIQRGAA